MEFLQGFLFLKQNVRSDNAKVVQASTKPAESWYTFPDISELCLLQELWSMAQEIQFDKKCAL